MCWIFGADAVGAINEADGHSIGSCLSIGSVISSLWNVRDSAATEV